MAIKIISGVLFPTVEDRAIGSAKIKFSDGSLLPGSGAKFKEVHVIGTGDYVGKPCVHISLRHILFSESPNKGLLSGLFDPAKHMSFNLNDDMIVENGAATGISISWATTPREEGMSHKSEISEIGVLIIGETK
jgi:hypothetical protein